MTQNTPTSIQYKDREWFFLDDLITFDQSHFRGFLKHKRRATQLIPESEWTFIKTTKGHFEDSHAAYKNARVIVTKEWSETNVPSFMNKDRPTDAVQPAPPLLQLSKDEMFRNVDGDIVNVEVRGTRNKDDIFFRCSDVAQLFEMESLDHNIARDYNKHEHYQLFLIAHDHPFDGRGRTETHSFFTYPGLIEVIYRSRSGVAHRFKEWANGILFVHHLGTINQKTDLVNDLQEQIKEMERRLQDAEHDRQHLLRLQEMTQQELEKERQDAEHDRQHLLRLQEMTQQELEKERQDAEHDRQHLLRLQEMMVTDEKLEPSQVIYIATSKNYAAQTGSKWVVSNPLKN